MLRHRAKKAGLEEQDLVLLGIRAGRLHPDRKDLEVSEVSPLRQLTAAEVGGMFALMPFLAWLEREKGGIV